MRETFGHSVGSAFRQCCRLSARTISYQGRAIMDNDETPIVRSKTAARQGRRAGVVWVLLGSLTLAILAAVALGYFV
jgi:hypothetical protein